jgi:hypothetical protein
MHLYFFATFINTNGLINKKEFYMYKPPNYRKIDQAQTKRISKGMEELANIHTKAVGGSGSSWYAKGDVINKMFLIEGKDKAKPSKQRTIYYEHIKKIRLEALNEGKMPLYAVGFGTGEDYFIIEDKDFYELLDRLIKAEEENKSC